ncbi:MAG: Teichoic acid biosynthesis protein B [uncultured Clostridium sp.]
MKLKKHLVDLTKIIIGYIVSSVIKIKKNNKDIWLISERRDEAQDNGYHLYKYIRENHPEQKVYYIIDKSSKDYKKIEKYKTIIQHNSLQHYIYYFLSDKHISAFQFFGVPETPFLWKLEEKGIIKKKKVFLQHGITQGNLPFLYYNKTKYDLFICGAKAEYEYISRYYGYPEKNVKYLGLCRFDNLHDYKIRNQILLMPTWRSWIGMTNEDNDIVSDINNFKQTEYYSTYNSLINNKRLNNILKENEFELIFYPHPEMQRFVNLFNVNNSRVKIVERANFNLQNLIKEAKIIITDYSSIAFDCAYMKKSLLYYQFDRVKYNKEHFSNGYFNHKNDGFGPVVENENDLINYIEKYILGIMDTNKYIQRCKEFFPIYDKKNCERNYEAIIKI